MFVIINYFYDFSTLLWSTLALLPLLGCTWIIGLLFVVNSESKALAWIFTIVNSLQVTIIITVYRINAQSACYDHLL